MIDFSNADNRYPWETSEGQFNPKFGVPCQWCETCLDVKNRCIADGCPCNNPRGINHGFVPKNTCTCILCDPNQTGSTRYPLEFGRSIKSSDESCKQLIMTIREELNRKYWAAPAHSKREDEVHAAKCALNELEFRISSIRLATNCSPTQMEKALVEIGRLLK